MNLLQWGLQSTRDKGIVRTGRIACNVALDLFFDWKYGTDTMRWVERAALDSHSENESHSAPYRATKVRPFLRLLRQLDLPRSGNFVDIGAGKGRVLLIAAQYGFRKVVGIEFSPKLCALARQNAEVFYRKKQRLSPIEIVEADACEHTFEAEDQVFFMYNPFDAVILSHVLDNLRSSVEEFPRRFWLIYNTPKHHEVVTGAGLFTAHEFREIGGNRFGIYTG